MIRNNTIAVRRARSPAPEEVASRDAADSTFVGVPVALRKLADGGVLENNRIEGSRIVGAEGLGIEVANASRNRIVGNTFADIATAALVLEGDRNRAELRSPNDVVRDRGYDNWRAAHPHRRFIELWRDADPELRPEVERAHDRLTALSRTTRPARND